MTRDEFAKLLYDNGVYNTLQFIDSAKGSMLDACYYKDLILELCKDILIENDQWRNSWTIDQIDEKTKWKKVNTGKWPRFETQLLNLTLSKIRLRDMFIKGFFQSCRNTFDEMAQAANAACLAFRAKRIEKVDFPQLAKVFCQQTYCQAFPSISSWFIKIQSSNDYKYIDMYCNRTKHTCSVETKAALPIVGEGKKTTIEPFYRQDSTGTIQNDRKEVVDYLQVAYEFMRDAYKDFIDALTQEVPKKTFTDNRLYTVSVYQKMMKGTPESNFSMAYIVEDPDYDSMPEQIEVLFITEVKQKILSMNCPFYTIYIRSKTNSQEYIGKYEAIDEIGEDSLLRFRKYKKIAHNKDELPLIYQAMIDKRQKDIYYNNNPFVEITTITDDEDFLRRVYLPF